MDIGSRGDIRRVLLDQPQEENLSIFFFFLVRYIPFQGQADPGTSPCYENTSHVLSDLNQPVSCRLRY